MNDKNVNTLKNAALFSAASVFWRLRNSLAFEEWFDMLLSLGFGVAFYVLMARFLAWLSRGLDVAKGWSSNQALKRDANNTAESLDSSSGADAVSSEK